MEYCDQCGDEITSDAPQGLCARCLLMVAAEPGSRIEQPGSEQAAPPTEGLPAAASIDIGDLAEVARRLPQFKILELLGRGGMGVVYKARQPNLDRIVAIKILPPADALAPGFVERFRREARSLAKLSHPNIVAVYEAGESNGLFYFVMEFIDGVNLRRMITAGRMAPSEALAIVPKICDALQYAHDEGIVHRDIKPENILIDKRSRVKIADFGLAKLLGRTEIDPRLTPSGAFYGTPGYMAPEQVERPSSVDHRADIYSMGVVFYEMLTGELPMGRFAPPSRKVQIDARLDEIVLHALERDVKLRYQHASEVRDDVANVTGSPAGGSSKPSGASAPGQAVLVAADGTGQYRRISDAIRAARAGAIIRVRPGTYREGLVIDKALDLVGDGPIDSVIVENDSGPCLSSTADSATVRGFTFRCTAGVRGVKCHAVDISAGGLLLEACDITSDVADAKYEAACVAVHGPTADPTIRSCCVHDGNGHGIRVYMQGNGTFEECCVFRNSTAGFLIQTGGNPVLRRCIIRDGAVGLAVDKQGRGVFEDCDVSRNASGGVVVMGGGNPTVRRCKIRNGESGVFVTGKSLGTFEDCDISGNSESQVVVTEGSLTVLRRCVIHDGKSDGVFVFGKGRGTFEDCDISGNSESQVVVTSGSNPVLRRCKIRDGKSDGVFVFGKGRGTFEDCDISGNVRNGVSVTGGSNPVLRRCKIHDGKGHGVGLYERGRGTFEDCELWANAGDDFNVSDGCGVRRTAAPVASLRRTPAWWAGYLTSLACCISFVLFTRHQWGWPNQLLPFTDIRTGDLLPAAPSTARAWVMETIGLAFFVLGILGAAFRPVRGSRFAEAPGVVGVVFVFVLLNPFYWIAGRKMYVYDTLAWTFPAGAIVHFLVAAVLFSHAL